MTTAEKFELVSIPVVVLLCWPFQDWLPVTTTLGRLLLYSFALLLFQGLLRDLWLLSRQRAQRDQAQMQSTRCMCMESTAGVVGIVAGAAVLGFGIDQSLSMSTWGWGCLVGIVMTAGFLIKDTVVAWKPFRVYRDPEHINIVFTWKQ